MPKKETNKLKWLAVILALIIVLLIVGFYIFRWLVWLYILGYTPNP